MNLETSALETSLASTPEGWLAALALALALHFTLGLTAFPWWQQNEFCIWTPALQRYIYHSPRSKETGSKALLNSLVLKNVKILTFFTFFHSVKKICSKLLFNHKPIFLTVKKCFTIDFLWLSFDILLIQHFHHDTFDWGPWPLVAQPLCCLWTWLGNCWHVNDVACLAEGFSI